MITVSFCIAALLLSGSVFAAPAPAVLVEGTALHNGTDATPASTAAWTVETLARISTDPDESRLEWNSDSAKPVPQPVRGSLGAKVIGPTDNYITQENADLLAPPRTDNGFKENAKWPFSMSKNHLFTGGWARQQNAAVMPFADKMAGVNMRLAAGAVRELHWHTTPEWAYVIKGRTQITAVDQNGQNTVATVGPGDLWIFPPGVPHSLQATADDPDGSEFILVFPNSDFSDDATFLLSEWLAHTPLDVLAKNFQADPEVFSHVTQEQLYIFPAEPPVNDIAPVSPQGTIEKPLVFEWSKVPATKLKGGSVKIVDSRTFEASTFIAAADVFVDPGAIRELHWHPTQDEWGFFLEGEGRITIFASKGIAGTFNYVAGDVAYVPAGMGHYVENTGNTTLHFLEVFNTQKYEDISLNTWLALTPPALVRAHLGLDNATMTNLFRTSQVLIGPTTDGTNKYTVPTGGWTDGKSKE